jgi:hypothetical protein
MPNKDTVLVVNSDIQVGSTLSVCPPRWNLFEGGTYRASPAQMIMYRQWVASANAVKDLLTEGRVRKRLVLVLNGEPVDNDHHGTAQLITRTPQEQIDMSITLLDEWLQIVDYAPKRGDCIYLVRGTSAHEQGEVIEQIGRDIDGVIPYRKDSSPLVKDGRYHHQKLRRTINGVLFDITHKGFGRGGRAWTRENGIRNALKSIYFDCLDTKQPIPEYVIRSHFHQYIYDDYNGRLKRMWGCITPCWQLKTHFVNQVAGNDHLNTIGLVMVDVTAEGKSKEYAEILTVEDTKVQEF